MANGPIELESATVFILAAIEQSTTALPHAPPRDPVLQGLSSLQRQFPY